MREGKPRPAKKCQRPVTDKNSSGMILILLVFVGIMPQRLSSIGKKNAKKKLNAKTGAAGACGSELPAHQGNRLKDSDSAEGTRTVS